jgi:short-subunit dehydrogenase
MGKNILVTGCSSGFGRDTCIELSSRGHRVIATTKTLDECLELRKNFEKLNLDIEVFKLDITNSEDVEKVSSYDLDVLVNNAGDGESGSLSEIPIEKIKSNFEINVFGTLNLTQKVLKNMIKKDSGKVIFISSLAGRVSVPFLGAYSMTKFSLSCGAECLREELKLISKNIKVCVVEPGAYNTGFNQKNISKMFEWMDEKSYFFNQIEKLRESQFKYFEILEKKSNSSIVNKIVSACESNSFKFRYVAPFWQGFGVRILRIFGK